MKIKFLSFLGLAVAVLAFIAVFLPVRASVSSYSASDFSQFCSQNSNTCNKVDFQDERSGSVSCPSSNQTITNVYVHAGNGQTVFELPDSGYSESFSNNNNTVTVDVVGTGPDHPDLSWIAVVCTSESTPTPTVSVTMTPTPTTEPGKITICHRTDSVTNPYERPTVDADSADGDTGNDNGQGDHSEHTGPVATSEAVAQALKDAKQNWGDIIPPHDNYAGLNWTTDGQAVYNNQCAYVQVSPTPTPTTSVTPTPTSTPGGGGDNGGGGGGSSSSSSVQGSSTGPTQAVLGLSATGSGKNIYLSLFQLLAGFTLSAVGFSFFKKNA